MQNIAHIDPVRKSILDFESVAKNQKGAILGDSEYCPLKHTFSDGIYVREIYIPADTYIAGKIHKHSHPNFLLSGTVKVVTEEHGGEILVGPMSMISAPGTKRALHTLTDCVWVTVHVNPTNTRNLEELEKIVIADTYEEYDRFKRLQNNPVIKFFSKLKTLLS